MSYTVYIINDHTTRCFPDLVGRPGARKKWQKELGLSNNRNDASDNLELLTVNLALASFVKNKQVNTNHFQDYLFKINYFQDNGFEISSEKTENQKTKVIGFFQWKVEIIAEYLPNVMNYQADQVSSVKKDSSEWQINPQIFQGICKIVGMSKIDLFASIPSQQLPAYMVWKLDPFSIARDTMQQQWTKYLYTF